MSQEDYQVYYDIFLNIVFDEMPYVGNDNLFYFSKGKRVKTSNLLLVGSVEDIQPRFASLHLQCGDSLDTRPLQNRSHSWQILELNSSFCYSCLQISVGAEGFRNRFLQDLLRSEPRGAQVLDLGCGPGANRKVINPDFSYVGVDLSDKYIGLLIENGGNPTYAWLKLSVPNYNPVNSLTLHEIGFKKQVY
jgi:hypothetical protein